MSNHRSDLPLGLAENINLRDRTHYQLGGLARYLGEPQTLLQLAGLLAWAKNSEIPIAVLGAGSNCAFADSGFPGLVIAMSQLQGWCWESPDTLFVQAGVTNTHVAELCRDAGRTGAEWMYHLPGQVGATTRINGRCYGREMADLVVDVFTLDINGRLHILSAAQMFLGYKKTRVQGRPEIVYAVRLRVPVTDSPHAIATHMEEFAQDRESKKQFSFPCCGSTFKNNYEFGTPSGRIFDELGFRGAREGGIQVADFHANFLLNCGGGTCTDLLTLAGRMREKALTNCGADLELEVEPIGLIKREHITRCALERLGPVVAENSDSAWVGVLWHPKQTAEKTGSASWPMTVMQAPVLPYDEGTPAKVQGLPDLTFHLEQLIPLADAQQHNDQPFLRWRLVSGDLKRHFQSQPEAPAGTFVDKLWLFDVAELFFADTQGNLYDEYEMTLALHWVAISHVGRRIRANGHTPPNAKHWSGVRRFAGATEMGMEWSWMRLTHLIDSEGRMRVRGAVSLTGERYFLAPHGGKPVQPPDFHEPGAYWLMQLL